MKRTMKKNYLTHHQINIIKQCEKQEKFLKRNIYAKKKKTGNIIISPYLIFQAFTVTVFATF